MEKKLEGNDAFLKGVIYKYMLPSILAMVATSAGALIDTVIVAGFLGEQGLSAMSLISPVYLIYYTIGAVIGIGGSIAANISIGKNNYERYRKIFTCSTVLMLLFSAITTLLGMVFLDPFAVLLGGTGDSLVLIKQYLSFYIPGGCFTLLAYIPLYFLKIEGKPRASSILFFLSSIINVLFTYLFMSPICNMGIAGASLATALSMAVTAICGFVILFTQTTETRMVRQFFSWSLVREIFLTGTPSGLNNLLNSVKIITVNYMILSVGSAVFLSTFSVIRNVSELMCSIMIGISSALLSIVGVFFGERDNPSVRKVFKNAIKIGAVIVGIFSTGVALFPDMISAAFNVRDPQMIVENRIALICVAVSFLFGFLNIVFSGFFSTTKRIFLSNMVVFLKQFLYLIVPAYVLSRFMGITGIWISFALAEILTLITLLAVIWMTRRRHPNLDHLLLDTAKEGAAEISFSVKNRIDEIMFASEKIVDFCEQNDIAPKKTISVSLALEEMLTIIITKCMDSSMEQFIDVRVKKLDEDVMIRIRNAGKLFDPVRYYEQNQENEELADEILGLRIIIKQAELIDFRQTFGANNLLIMF